MAMSDDRVLLNVSGSVAHLTLRGIGQGNAIDEVAAAEMREACGEVDDRRDVVVLVISGQGDGFCRGSALAERPTPGMMASHRVASAVAAVGKPTVAAIEGDALDQGLEIAVACDLRVVGSDARLGMTQAASGGIPWDGGTQRLPRLVGRALALEMLLMARVLSGREAAGCGLATEATVPGDALGRATEIAALLATHGPLALRYLKEAVHRGADLPLGQAMQMEGDLATLLISTGDRAEGLRAFAEKRRPEFVGE